MIKISLEMIEMTKSRSKDKSQIRTEIWALMEKRGIARFPRPVFNRIPNFVGSENAAQRLIELKEYKSARTIFCNPDSPQRPVREHILRDGKILIMAPPRLREDGFLVLSKKSILTDKIRRASTIKGAFQFGSIVKPSAIDKIDLKIAGSVAVDRKGGRVGKGGGYSDLEFGILTAYDLIDKTTRVLTTVHEVQLVENIPMTEHDVSLDIVITPNSVIYTNTTYQKPQGILWELLSDLRICSIPMLEELKSRL
ncbi:MAG: 5-formyltetrahydrofolate cyclo-ligase [Candidatus Sifarchaeia archaeon]|jgi:5-formyltetrahydrofolate cyclo-ligase